MTTSNDPLWYKDAIIYQLHIKAFFDANNDGIGDFAGLAAKLDYIKELGANTLWLLPFYPSPLRDDGYDIADYCDVNPSYGTIDDFRNFIDQAHEKGLRVITELVINHTSDQHPWFQRARKAPEGSNERDYYVWSDTNEKYAGTRIIFSDTETSNWTWDKEANAFYWHRFFSHQPDLNFSNPDVLNEVLEVMYFWLEMGVDGLRLDAVPYLCEREGTNNENLPETHEILKKIRTALDARFENRLLLAEANQWPEDVMDYFGKGDECHMAFHFPLMPRTYMALAQEDRHPVTDIMNQTPDIPDNCQWAIFLRNHDELTLEMVTDRERDYLWDYYAVDKRARINFGIRRRLAPLMDNDRRKIELLNSLLMSMPGTPVIYYGDEIGMGDNIYLGDRDGVRTPMQWSPDRNGGYSLSDPARLYLPAIMDPVYGFQSVNVETQKRVKYSLFNWMRNLIAVARSTQVFGRGTLRFLAPANRKVLAYLRTYEDKTILCVVNLSRAPQAVELDMREFNGKVPVEMLGMTEFPAIGELPYLLTLAPYGFYWFMLSEKSQSALEPEPIPDLVTLVIANGWESFTAPSVVSVLQKRILPDFLPRQRWYKGKNAEKVTFELLQLYAVGADYRLAVVRTTSDNQSQLYVMALGISWESRENAVLPTPASLSRVRRANRVGILYEVSADEAFLAAMLTFLQSSQEAVSGETVLKAYHNGLPDMTGLPVVSLGAEQTNSSAKVGEAYIFKIVRQPLPGMNVEEEMGLFLTDVSAFDRSPSLLGGLRIEGGEKPVTIGLIQAAIRNQGDGWKVTLDYLERLLTDTPLAAVAGADVEEPYHYYNVLACRLGQRTAQMHRALNVKSGNPYFDPEPVTKESREQWLHSVSAIAERAFANLSRMLPRLPDEVRSQAETLLQKREELQSRLKMWLPQGEVINTRVHGDYHLGQVLVAENDFYIIDFEGEPARSLEERRQKNSPCKDVAGMIRSFDYAASSTVRKLHPLTGADRMQNSEVLAGWKKAATESFLSGYAMDGGVIDQGLLHFFLLEKALYEIVYETQHRPDWVEIPLKGVLDLLGENES